MREEGIKFSAGYSLRLVTIKNSLKPMDKEDVVHIYNGTLLSHEKEWNNSMCSHMDGPKDCHTEWSKSYREGEIPYDIPYMWSVKRNETN